MIQAHRDVGEKDTEKSKTGRQKFSKLLEGIFQKS